MLYVPGMCVVMYVIYHMLYMAGMCFALSELLRYQQSYLTELRRNGINTDTDTDGSSSTNSITTAVNSVTVITGTGSASASASANSTSSGTESGSRGVGGGINSVNGSVLEGGAKTGTAVTAAAVETVIEQGCAAVYNLALVIKIL
jgi:hypothetical protein